MQGWTPLHLAVSQRNKQMTAKLLESEADPSIQNMKVWVSCIGLSAKHLADVALTTALVS